jgi:hypothetical protein
VLLLIPYYSLLLASLFTSGGASPAPTKSLRRARRAALLQNPADYATTSNEPPALPILSLAD